MRLRSNHAVIDPVVDLLPSPFRYDQAHQLAHQRRHVAGKRVDISAMTGAAAIFTEGSNSPEAVPPPSATRQWQTNAWGYVDIIGELSNAMRIYGNCFRRVQLVGAILNDQGTVSMTFADDEPEKEVVDAATKILQELRGPYGGQAYIMERLGTNTFTVGECFLYQNDAVDGHEGTWEVLSTDELRPVSSGAGYVALNPQTIEWIRYYGPGFNPRYLPKDAYICRVWRPHPRYSRHANSSVRALLEILEEIALLTREVRGETVSRISSAGVVAIADEFSFPNSEDAQPGTEDFDPFTREFLDTMMTSITDKGSAAGVAPMVLRAPADLIEKGFRYFSFARPDAAVAMAKRREALERFAQGIELPPEWIFGHASTTFANAMQITEDAFRLYIEPGLSEVCEAITQGYLWPRLMKDAGLDPYGPVPDEIRMQVCSYDASHLISKPDRTKAAEDAYKNIEISGHTYRQTLGFTEDDKPDEQEVAVRIRTDQERQQRVTIRGTDVNLPVVVDPALLQLENQPGNQDGKYKFPDGADPYEQPPPGETSTPPPFPGQPPAPPVPGHQPPAALPPAAPGQPVPPPPAIAAVAHTIGILALRLQSAGELAVDRAVDKVGAKIRSAAQRNPILVSRLEGIPNAFVAAELGPESVERLIGAEEFVGEWAAFRRRITAWAREHGTSDCELLAEKATRLVEDAARARLYDPDAQLDIAAFSLLTEEVLVSA